MNLTPDFDNLEAWVQSHFNISHFEPKKAPSLSPADMRIKILEWANNKGEGHVPKKALYGCNAGIVRDNSVYVVTSHIGEGSSKKISIMLDNVNREYVRAAIRPTRQNRDCYERIYELARIEVTFLHELHTKLSPEERAYFTDPYLMTIETKTSRNDKSLILLQKKYDGDGRKIDAANKAQVIKFLSDSAKALSILHKLGFVHSDFKPENVLIEIDSKDPHSIQGKLHDFGTVVKIGENFISGTPRYMPPEAYNEGTYRPTPASDAYALGVTILEMGFGSTSFNLDEKIFTDLERRFDQDEVLLKLICLAKRLLNRDPSKRASCDEAFQEFQILLAASRVR
jgi:serine/threonine protein kinase